MCAFPNILGSPSSSTRSLDFFYIWAQEIFLVGVQHLYLYYNQEGILSQRSQRDVDYLGWPIAPSYMSPNAGRGGGGLRGLSWVQLCTRSPNKLWRSNSIFNLWNKDTGSPSFYQFLLASFIALLRIYCTNNSVGKFNKQTINTVRPRLIFRPCSHKSFLTHPAEFFMFYSLVKT